MSDKYRIFKDGDMWSVTSPSGSTLSLPTWRGAIRQVCFPERDRYFHHWKNRMRMAEVERFKPNEYTRDVLLTDRVKLLQEDPDEYFRRYPAPRFGWVK